MNKKINIQKNNVFAPLDEYEKDLMEMVENEELKPLAPKDHKKMATMLSTAVKNTYAKRKTVNLRLSERDLMNLKVKAAEEGIPYQTLMTSILHRYISGKIA